MSRLAAPLLSFLLWQTPEFTPTVRTGGDAAPKKASSCRVLNWNIDRGYHLDQIRDAIRRQEPDICVLQEVDWNARRTGQQDIAAVLSKEFGYRFAFVPEFQELSQGEKDRPAFHGNAILTRLPARNFRALRYERQSGFWRPRGYLPDWALFQRRLGGRIALIAELELGDKLLVVYDLHLESRSGGAIQMEQLEETLADTKRYPEGTGILIAGDLNSKYNPSTFAKRMEEAGYRNCMPKRRERTHVLIGYLDWMFVHGDVGCAEGAVLRGTPGSDHFPMVTRLLR